MIAPILIFAYGNLSRGDDALAPLLIEKLVETGIDTEKFEFLTDFQLQIEHALDLDSRELVLFVDAAVNCENSLNFLELKAIKDKSYTTHAMSPASVLQVYESVNKKIPPPCFLLSIKGFEFELGEGLSDMAKDNLQQAFNVSQDLLVNSHLDYWHQQVLHFA